MSVLSLLKKVKVQTLSFEKHPCKDQDQEVMIHYLNGLALLSQEDQNICDMEKEYLEILINSFGLSDDMLESITDFAMNPNEKQILDMMQSFMGKEIKYNFIMDAMMIAVKDGNFDDAEKEVIRQYGEMFKLTSKEMEDLHKLFELFYAQDGNGLYRYFKRNEYMKVELFQYLLDYYSIDMAYELKEDEKKLLTFEFFKPELERVTLKCGSEVMSESINHAQFCIFLNAMYLTKQVEFNSEGKVADTESKDTLMDLEKSAIKFENNTFTVSSEEDEGIKATGMTYVMAEKFIIWVNENYPDDEGKMYKFIQFGGENCFVSIKNFKASQLLFEFIDSVNYGRNAYTTLWDAYGYFALQDDGNPLNPSKTSCFENVGFRMMR